MDSGARGVFRRDGFFGYSGVRQRRVRRKAGLARARGRHASGCEERR
jgi:hypothetical protein